MRQRITVWTFFLASLAATACGDLVLDDFDAEPERWGAGTSLDAEHVKQGDASMRWPAGETGHISRADIPHDWTEYRAISFWLFSEKATDSILVVSFTSDDPETEGGDYFVLFDRVNWSGWREFELVLDTLGRARSPLGLDEIEAIHFYAVGWGQQKLVPDTVLYLDDMRLISRTEEELAALREQQRRLKFGHVTPMSEFEDVLELLSRGGDGVANWAPLASSTAAADSYGLRQDWHGATLWATGEGRSGHGRDYDVDVSEYREMVIGLRVGEGTSLDARVVIDGEETLAQAQPGTAQLRVAIDGERLERLDLEIAGSGEASIEWVVLRRAELPEVHGFSNKTGSVMLAWDRPAWGAESYRVYRSPGEITAANVDDAEVVVQGVASEVASACDFPPSEGEWHYAVAAISGEDAMDPGSDFEVTVAGEAAPVIGVATDPITVDGDLGDWPQAGSRIRFGGAGDVAAGEEPGSADDLSAAVMLCHDDTSLFVAAEVTDDTVRHASARSWEGDGLVVMLAFDPPEIAARGRRYGIVINYTSGTPGAEAPVGTVLEDRVATHPADAKPPAPGTWAVAYREGGYAIEASIPIEALRGYGFDPRVGGIALGLSVYDGDQADGPTTRETAVSWNQREDLYDPREAAVVRWE